MTIKNRPLEVVAEIPEDINENCQQDAEEFSPVQLVTEGKRLLTSISQTLDKIAKDTGELPSSSAECCKQSDVNGTRQVATYFANSTVPNEILAARPSVNSFEGTPLSTPFEQNDKDMPKDMPKARRSQSVGQFPSTPNKHKVR